MIRCISHLSVYFSGATPQQLKDNFLDWCHSFATIALNDGYLVKKADGSATKGIYHQMSHRQLTELEKNLAVPLGRVDGRMYQARCVGRKHTKDNCLWHWPVLNSDHFTWATKRRVIE